MSPRSTEFLEKARERLAAARESQKRFPDVSISLAYYACLYAARAALSEEDRYAKTHNGVWTLFSELFVKTGRIGTDLGSEVQKMEEDRIEADYEAARFSAQRAGEALHVAERFVDAIERLYA